jgi:hypothetical protein
MHQLAEQWKHFGTSTIHKLESQIVDYQAKLSELEQRQLSLLQENDALKARVDQSAISTVNQDSQSKEVRIHRAFGPSYFCPLILEEVSTETCVNANERGETRLTHR